MFNSICIILDFIYADNSFIKYSNRIDPAQANNQQNREETVYEGACQ